MSPEISSLNLLLYPLQNFFTKNFLGSLYVCAKDPESNDGLNSSLEIPRWYKEFQPFFTEKNCRQLNI